MIFILNVRSTSVLPIMWCSFHFSLNSRLQVTVKNYSNAATVWHTTVDGDVELKSCEATEVMRFTTSWLPNWKVHRNMLSCSSVHIRKYFDKCLSVDVHTIKVTGHQNLINILQNIYFPQNKKSHKGFGMTGGWVTETFLGELSLYDNQAYLEHYDWLISYWPV